MNRMDLDRMVSEWCKMGLNEGLPGWCTLHKANWLVDNILSENLIHIVELGVFGGRSLLPMGGAVKLVGRGGYVLGVDSYSVEKQIEGMSAHPAHVEWGKAIDFESLHNLAMTEIRKADLQSHCGIVRAASSEIACLIGMLDLLHIDACHSIISSCRDVETWVPKVRPGGLIVLDDCEWETVKSARSMLKEMCGGEVSYSSGNGWEVYRKVN